MAHMIAEIYQAVQTRLTQSNEIWFDRAFADLAPAGTVYPYVVYTVESTEIGDFLPLHQVKLAVRCVSGDLAQALAGARRVDDLLHDADHDTAKALDGADWVFRSVTRERFTHDARLINGALVISAGAVYRVVLEPAEAT